MKKKEIIYIYPKMLKELFQEDGIEWRTGMNRKHEYACVMIAVGKPKLNEKTWKIEQRYRKRYLSKELTQLIRSSKIL